MLKISNLSFSYHNQDIFAQTNLTLPNQARVAIIGNNGIGKSTLLKLLNNILSPDSGSIKIDGAVGYLPQINSTPSNKSGGEHTRFVLDELFAKSYDVLLLDEPTNNLDEASLDHLISKIHQFHGLLLFVSHDRNFIDQIAEYILVVQDQKLNLYTGNYSDCITRQSQFKAQQLQKYRQAQKLKANLKAQINQAKRRATATNRSYNKLRDENRLVFNAHRNQTEASAGKLVKTASNRLAKLDQITKPEERKIYRATINVASSRRRRLLSIHNLTKTYPDRPLFQNLNLEIYSGENYQISGNNGTGKTTLFRIILGEIPPTSGTVTLAPNLKVDYIAQDVYGLDLNCSFLDQSEAAPTSIFQAAVTLDLTRSDLAKPCHQLSRGQLTKLAFLNVLLSPVDLLILDEPTNHLDLRARENLEQTLSTYPGAILFATHDHAFAQALSPEKTCHLENIKE